MFESKATPTTEGEPIPPISATPSLVDTSVIIDGRIADIARAGFAPGKLLIPRFVLAELQLIADSGDAMKRSRGRRGLEMLHGMREAGVDMEIIEHDYDDIKEVDAKLVRLGRHLHCNVLTTDYNLNRVASIEGVRVLNINELANAVRPVILPGERMFTKVVQPGKERGQGVGYLADGTMIVVDGGDKLTGQDVEVEITRVFQTVAGKMLFAVVVPGQSLQPTGRNRSLERPAERLKSAGHGGQARHIQPNQPDHGGHKTSRRGPRAASHSNANSDASRRNAQSRQPSPQTPLQPQRPGVQPQPTTNRSAPKSNRSVQPEVTGGKSERRRPKRVSPTQRLEDSLVELTNGHQNPPKNS